MVSSVHYRVSEAMSIHAAEAGRRMNHGIGNISSQANEPGHNQDAESNTYNMESTRKNLRRGG